MRGSERACEGDLEKKNVEPSPTSQENTIRLRKLTAICIIACICMSLSFIHMMLLCVSLPILPIMESRKSGAEVKVQRRQGGEETRVKDNYGVEPRWHATLALDIKSRRDAYEEQRTGWGYR
ncbi:hypothetical protein U0070_022365, partial [Myodes glareolus]